MEFDWDKARVDWKHTYNMDSLEAMKSPGSADIALAYSNAECLYSEQEINAALMRMAARIRHEMADSEPVILCVMVGALVTAGSLLPMLNFPLQVDYVHLSRYHGDTHGGKIEWHREPRIDLKDRTVLIVDDILDEGHTLACLIDFCKRQGAARVLSAVLVEKRHNRKHPEAEANFTALQVDDRYIFGFGMDYRDYLRNLPGIYAIKGN